MKIHSPWCLAIGKEVRFYSQKILLILVGKITQNLPTVANLTGPPKNIIGTEQAKGSDWWTVQCLHNYCLSLSQDTFFFSHGPIVSIQNEHVLIPVGELPWWKSLML